MGLPAIEPYQIPESWPANRAGWRPDPQRAVLLVHDMQAWFLRRYAGAPLPTVLSKIALLRGHCAELGIPVVFTAQLAQQDPTERALLTDFWGPGIPSLAEAELQVTPSDVDTVLTKWRYSAFVRTGLAELLGERDQLIITGVYGHIGILATACDAFMRDVQTFVAADAIADFSGAHHQQALDWAARRCSVVATTGDLCRELVSELDSIQKMMLADKLGLSFLDMVSASSETHHG